MKRLEMTFLTKMLRHDLTRMKR